MVKTIVAVVSTLLAMSVAAPISSTTLEAADFATNVLMTSGPSQFAMWAPIDGQAYSTASITCLNVLSSSSGACNVANIDQVGVLEGYTCAFRGSQGWSGMQSGTSSSGWMSVAPPQTISSVACMAG